MYKTSIKQQYYWGEFVLNNIFYEKSIALFGSTGSIGKQSIEVAREHNIKIKALTANQDIDRLETQIREFKPEYCGVVDEQKAKELTTRVADTDTVIDDLYTHSCHVTPECCSDMTHYNTPEGAAYMGGKVLSVICRELGISAAEIKVEGFELEKYTAENIGY